MGALVDEAAVALRIGRVVVLPTDTVYGIGCLPHLPEAVASIFELKGRPDDKPLPVLGASLGDLARVALFDSDALLLSDRFWPGPLTLVLPRAPGFTHDLGGHEAATIAVRVPESETALALLNEVGPLAVTSANLSGQPPAVTVDQARSAFGERVAVYLDDGRCDRPASTVVAMAGGMRVLRTGPVSEEELRQIVTS